jgi:hypothetical protein
MYRDGILCFSGVPTAAAPEPTVIIPASATTTLMPQVVDTSPLGLPTGSGGGSSSLPNAGRDLGIGGEMWLQVLLATVAASSSGTWQAQFVTGATTTPATVLLSSPVLSNATMIAALASGPTSVLWRTQLPAGNASGGGAGGVAYAQYVGVQQVVASAGFTTGTVFAEMLINVQASDELGSGFTVQ